MNRSYLVVAAVLAAIVVFFMLLPTPEAPPPGEWSDRSGNSFVLRDVRVFDGAAFLERRNLVVQDGIITAISPRTPAPEGLPELDGSGHTLLPGLIDSHTHNFGTARVDALRFGVTTQIDMFSSSSALQSARAQRESVERTDQADMWSAGTLVTAPGGHGTQFGMPIPTLSPGDDAAAFVAARVAEGSDFIKLVLEDGAGWGGTMPTLDSDTLQAAIAAAHELGKLAVVHTGSRDEAELALRAGADGLVHLFGDVEVDEAIVTLARAHDAFVIPTLAVLESASGRASGMESDVQVAPWLTPEQADGLRRTFPEIPGRERVIERASIGALRLHQAGVPMLAGSDAPNPGTAHGASLHRELELLVAAGLSTTEALASATSVPARHFGLEDRGRIARGLRADLVLVSGDPGTDITATRSIVAVWKNGYLVPRPRVGGRAEVVPALDAVVLR